MQRLTLERFFTSDDGDFSETTSLIAKPEYIASCLHCLQTKTAPHGTREMSSEEVKDYLSRRGFPT